MGIKKILSTILLMTFATGMLVGCGGTSSNSQGKSSESEDEIVTLTYTTWGSTNELEAQKKAVEEFEKNIYQQTMILN